MKYKRYFAAAVIAVALLLALGACAVSAELKADMIAPWEKAQQTPEPERTAPPVDSLQPLPAPVAMTAPAVPAETDAPGDVDIDSLMLFSPDDVDYIKSLWPLKTFAPEAAGTFYSIFASYDDDYLYLTYTFKSDRALKDLKTELKACVSGAWSDGDTGASAKAGMAEGIETDCGVYDYTDYRAVEFTFGLNGDYSEINDIMDSHWPGGMIDMPPEMEVKDPARCVMLSPGRIYLSYDWEFSVYKDAFKWFRENMPGMDGFKYSPASASDDENIVFKIGDADAEISVSNTYGAIYVTFISYPADFEL